MKIATLNLNGGTYKSINCRPRLPEDLFDIMKIKESLINRAKAGLGKILENQDLDIIAIQELVYSQAEKNALKKIVEEKGYRLIIPKVDGRTHFTVGFIVKNDSNIDCVTLCDEESLSSNRLAILDFKKNKIQYSIVNMHVKDHNIAIPNPEGNVILLGDMNAFTGEQSTGKIPANSEFLNKIMLSNNKYIELGKDEDYTWISNNEKKKLDHIFISETLLKCIDEFKYTPIVTKDDSVNFYDDKGKKKGFTDHSMLILEFRVEEG